MCSAISSMREDEQRAQNCSCSNSLSHQHNLVYSEQRLLHSQVPAEKDQDCYSYWIAKCHSPTKPKLDGRQWCLVLFPVGCFSQQLQTWCFEKSKIQEALIRYKAAYCWRRDGGGLSYARLISFPSTWFHWPSNR